MAAQTISGELARNVAILHDAALEFGELYRSGAVLGASDELPAAARPDEWAITERWLREDPRLTLQRIAHEKGTAILTRSH